MLRVTVPENSNAGDRLLVKYNDTMEDASNNRFLEVTIPEGLFPGQAFFVEIPTTPPPSSEIPVYTVTGEAIPHATTQTEPTSDDLELYKV
jgi:hypothetical protein